MPTTTGSLGQLLSVNSGRLQSSTELNLQFNARILSEYASIVIFGELVTVRWVQLVERCQICHLWTLE